MGVIKMSEGVRNVSTYIIFLTFCIISRGWCMCFAELNGVISIPGKLNFFKKLQ
jgi:hypothetical protein